MNADNRGKWTSRIGFILAAGGSAVGLGNLWKFPYITYDNGGGLFILVYLVCIAVVGVPIMFSEILIGKITEKDPVGAFKSLAGRSPFVLVGYLGVITGFLILSYYSIVAGWTLEFMLRGAAGNFIPNENQALVEFRMNETLKTGWDKLAPVPGPATAPAPAAPGPGGAAGSGGDTGIQAGDTQAQSAIDPAPLVNKRFQRAWNKVIDNLTDKKKAKLNQLSPDRQWIILNSLRATPHDGIFDDKHLCYFLPKATYEKSRQTANAQFEAAGKKHLQSLGFSSRQEYQDNLERNIKALSNREAWLKEYKASFMGGIGEAKYETFLKTDEGLEFRKQLLSYRMAKDLDAKLDAAKVAEAENRLSEERGANEFTNTRQCLDYYSAWTIPTDLIAAKKEQFAMAAVGTPLADKHYINQQVNREFVAHINNNGVEVFWQVVMLILCVIVVGIGVGKGIQRASELLMPVLLILMIIIAINALINDQNNAGLKYLFKWDWDKGVSEKGIREALGHAFFTLSLGMGAMITYGSYVAKSVNVVRSGLMIVLLDTFIAFLACLMLFPVIFAHNLDISASTGMLFTVVPLQLITLPGGYVMAVIFYVLVAMAALTSAISLLEVATAYVIDELCISRTKATLGAALLTFLVGIPQAMSDNDSLIEIFDGLVNIFLPLGGMLIALYTGWFLDQKPIRAEFEFMPRAKLFVNIYIWLCRIAAPGLVILVLYNTAGGFIRHLVKVIGG